MINHQYFSTLSVHFTREILEITNLAGSASEHTYIATPEEAKAFYEEWYRHKCEMRDYLWKLGKFKNVWEK